MSKVQGTVKWFSNRKGYGFITPTSEDAPTSEDIFVHQSEVESEGFRSLGEGWTVEFTIDKDDAGKLKAVHVTAPGGGPCTGPRIRHSQRSTQTKKSDSGAAPNGRRTSSSFWHASLTDEVKQAMLNKSIRTKTGTVDVSFGSHRIKLGAGGYSAMAHADAMLAEGTFEAQPDGTVALSWDRAMVFEGGEWKSCDTGSLLKELSLMDEKVGPVKLDETPEMLWGEGKTDPKDALDANGFSMRQVVLTRRPSSRGGGGSGNRRRSRGKPQEKEQATATTE